ncbi:MAG: hypothetical protein ACI82N_001224, partial [Maricaulis sp.]
MNVSSSEAFQPPKPPYARYTQAGHLTASDYWTYFRAM